LSNQNIEKLKKLLEEGYQITSKNIVIEPEKGESKGASISVKISLAKGKETDEIFSENDSEFFWFSERFIKKRDQFDNYIFEYSETDKPSLSPDQIPKSSIDKHIIKIGSRKFEKGVWLRYIEPPQPKKIQYAEFILISKDNPELKNVDYKDWVKIIDKSSGKAIFGGFIRDAQPIHEDIVFLCMGSDKYVQYSKITLELLSMTAVESLYFTAKLTNLKTKIDSAILAKLNLNNRNFIVIMPITNLVIQEIVNIGDTTIYNKLDSSEDHLIRKSQTCRTDNDWNGNNLRIRTEVMAKDFHEAIFKGYNRISRTIDWLAFRSDFFFSKL